MTAMDESRDGEAEEANDKLNEGLKSCRAVVSNYRALLDQKANSSPLQNDPTSDDSETGEGGSPAKTNALRSAATGDRAA
jgi:hypothetical protein